MKGLSQYFWAPKPPPPIVTAASLDPLPPPKWYDRLCFDPMGWIYALVNTARIAQTVIANRADLMNAFSKTGRRNDRIYSFPTANGTRNHIVANAIIARKILEQGARHDPSDEGVMLDFENARAYEPVLRAILGIPSTRKEDLIESFVLTASAGNAKKYHMAIVTHLSQVKDQAALLKPLIHDTIDSWARLGEVDARQMGRNLAMQAIFKLFFNTSDIDTDPLQKALDCVMDRMTNAIVQRPPSPEEKIAYERSLIVLREGVDAILKQEILEGSILEAVPEYSDLQKKALIYVLLVAGVDTTGTLINYLLWELGTGKTLSKENIPQFIQEGLRNHTPAPLIARYPKKGCVITVYDSNGNRTYHTVRPKEGLLIVPELFSKATKTEEIQFFGGGPHLCPGKNLSLLEIRLFFEYLLEKEYTVVMNDKKPLASSSLMVRKAEPAFVSLVKIKN